MTARFRLPAGRSYNVRASELARDRQHTEVVCNIVLLDNTVQPFKVNKHDQGQVLLDAVFKHLELTERDYFGLHLADDSSDCPVSSEVTGEVRPGLSRGSPHHLNFRVKFFVSDPSKLQEEYTRYQYFLQIKQDILSGRLPCPHNTAALLASYTVQSELGDYSEAENPPGYLSGYCFIPNQPQGFEKEVAKHHQQHSGLSPAESEFNYLNTARTLEHYGVELHYARDQSNTEILIGVMSAGIFIYKNRVRINCFPCCMIIIFFFFLFSTSHFLQNETRETLLGFNMVNYRACKNLWKTCVEHHTFFRLDQPVPPQKNFFAHYFSLGSKFRYCGRTEAQSVQYGKEKGIKDRVFARSPSKPLARKLMGMTDWEAVSRNSLSEERLETQSLPTRSPPGTPNHRNSLFVQEGPRPRPSSMGHLVEHVIHASPSLPAFTNHKSASSTQANSISLESTPSPEGVDGPPPALPPKQSRKNLSQLILSHSQQDLDNHINEMYDIPVATEKATVCHTHAHTLKYTHNAPQSSSGPHCSTVLPVLPLSLVIPQHQEVSLIHVFNYLLFFSLQQLYRKRPGMTMSCAKLPQNISKNRYRDISPYDATRVILKGTDDYINANYINMEIPASSIINRYIACQGPLPNTCSDFWQMTWEQGSSMVVMLTTQVERGRVKCHQYWPNPSGTATYDGFQVSCQTEEGNSAFLVREMTLTHIETEESRELTQIQYLAWPDHGVPDDSTDFLDFVALVRSKRAGKDEPVVVHCRHTLTVYNIKKPIPCDSTQWPLYWKPIPCNST
uniref:protein-tyrosine-phosphatase n=1 Tax=Astyanax mexicanus TaxID=7994 RepID=A0A8B9K1L7_ASTMX